MTGVSWQTSVMGLKFLDGKGNGTTANAITAIERAVQAKQAGADVRVINASWGGSGYSTALRDEIARAGDNGILFVAAAGNNAANNDTTPSYPAAYSLPTIISVAATDNRDQLAPFSDYGASSVDLAAPGVAVLSTLPGGTYGYLSGTSMATPQVSGAAALVLSAEPTLTTAQLKTRLLGAVDPVPSLAGRTVTGGRLDVCQAVTGCTTRGASSVSLTTSGNAGVGVAAVVLTAGIGPGSATGTVAFRDGGVAVPGCAAMPVSGGQAQCVTTFATAGAHPITTAYSGDGVLLPATATTTVDVTATPNLFQLLLGVLLRFVVTFHLFGF